MLINREENRSESDDCIYDRDEERKDSKNTRRFHSFNYKKVSEVLNYVKYARLDFIFHILVRDLAHYLVRMLYYCEYEYL